MRDVSNVVASSSKYVDLKISLSKRIEERAIVAKIQRQVHIVDDLKTNMLIDSNIMGFEDMKVNYQNFIMIVDSCNDIRIFMNVIIAEKIQRMIRVLSIIVVSTYFIMMIFTRLRSKSKTKLSSDKDFMFTSYHQTSMRFDIDGDILNHMIDVNMCAMQVNNIFDDFVIITRNCRLSIVHEYEKKDCYAVTLEDAHFVVDRSLLIINDFNRQLKRASNKTWFKKAIQVDVEALVVLSALVGALTASDDFDTTNFTSFIVFAKDFFDHDLFVITSEIFHDISFVISKIFYSMFNRVILNIIFDKSIVESEIITSSEIIIYDTSNAQKQL